MVFATERELEYRIKRTTIVDKDYGCIGQIGLVHKQTPLVYRAEIAGI